MACKLFIFSMGECKGLSSERCYLILYALTNAYSIFEWKAWLLLPYIYTQLLEIRLNGHNFVSFEATISRFFMVIDLNDTYKMMMMTLMMIIIMLMIINWSCWLKFKMTKTRPIWNLQPQDFAWWQILMIPTRWWWW